MSSGPDQKCIRNAIEAVPHLKVISQSPEKHNFYPPIDIWETKYEITENKQINEMTILLKSNRLGEGTLRHFASSDLNKTLEESDRANLINKMKDVNASLAKHCRQINPYSDYF